MQKNQDFILTQTLNLILEGLFPTTWNADQMKFPFGDLTILSLCHDWHITETLKLLAGVGGICKH